MSSLRTTMYDRLRNFSFNFFMTLCYNGKYILLLNTISKYVAFCSIDQIIQTGKHMAARIRHKPHSELTSSYLQATSLNVLLGNGKLSKRYWTVLMCPNHNFWIFSTGGLGNNFNASGD